EFLKKNKLVLAIVFVVWLVLLPLLFAFSNSYPDYAGICYCETDATGMCCQSCFCQPADLLLLLWVLALPVSLWLVRRSPK
ncbi:hypothetical protein KJ891_00350, partial [Candidatus Micrarchaeota archaeon]|nr:hypothetical protein [Candidatus Micrarchaeota archaeon]